MIRAFMYMSCVCVNQSSVSCISYFIMNLFLNLDKVGRRRGRDDDFTTYASEDEEDEDQDFAKDETATTTVAPPTSKASKEDRRAEKEARKAEKKEAKAIAAGDDDACRHRDCSGRGVRRRAVRAACGGVA